MGLILAWRSFVATEGETVVLFVSDSNMKKNQFYFFNISFLIIQISVG